MGAPGRPGALPLQHRGPARMRRSCKEPPGSALLQPHRRPHLRLTPASALCRRAGAAVGAGVLQAARALPPGLQGVRDDAGRAGGPLEKSLLGRPGACLAARTCTADATWLPAHRLTRRRARAGRREWTPCTPSGPATCSRGTRVGGIPCRGHASSVWPLSTARVEAACYNCRIPIGLLSPASNQPCADITPAMFVASLLPGCWSREYAPRLEAMRRRVKGEE